MTVYPGNISIIIFINKFMKKLFLLLLLCGGCTSPDFLQTHAGATSLSTATAMVGLDEKTDRELLKDRMGVDPVQTQWCAAFVNYVLNYHGFPGSESVSSSPLTARSFIYWGSFVTSPEFGDIVVFPRGNQGWQGHVGFYIETVQFNGIDYYVILGGNQDDKVSYDLYPASKAIAIRRLEPGVI